MKKIILVAAALTTTLMMNAQQKRLTLENVIDDTFEVRGPSDVTPMADGEHYLTSVDNRLILRNSFKTGQVTDTVLDLRSVRGVRLPSFDGFILSPTEDVILLQTNTEKIYRRSFKAEYYIFTIRNNKIDPMTEGPVMCPAFSPDGHNIAFVRDNNIFIIKMLFNNAEVQVTKDGEAGKIRCGVADWAYEEEFGLTRAFEFSADSRMLAWIRFDESHVDSFNLPFYLTQVDRDSYSQNLLSYNSQKYPTAGAATSKVSVQSFDIKSSVTRDMGLKLDTTTYIPRIKFVENADNDLLIFTLNRNQNRLEIYSGNPRSTLCTIILRQDDERFIDEFEYNDTKVYPDGFIMLSERDGHRHLYQYDLLGKLKRQITSGDFDVLAFHGYDAKKGIVFYESNESGIYDCAVWKQDAKGRKTRLTPEQGTSHAVFSADLKYFMNSWSDLNTPTRITIISDAGKTLSTVESNDEVEANKLVYNLAHKETFSFETPDGITLYGWMVKPADASESKPCPLVMFQYSGPGSNKVLNQWEAGFYPGGTFESLLVKQGYAVAVVDGRGTDRRGADFKKQVYKHLGVLESKDQVAAAQYLGSLPYIDSERIAIWGWSYGGYNTLMSMSEGTPVFKCGVAVAPVTDWRLYDAIYTERFLQQPKENAQGYLESSAIERVGKLHGKLLIIHGLDDDNVYFSHTAAYTSKLIENGIDFDMQVYPGKDHGIKDPTTRYHLFNRILRFLAQNL